jgi:predicted aspartyl protease
MKVLATALAVILPAAALAQAVPEPELTEVVVTAPEPRYVAPTTRDRIGRVWVPVKLSDKGVFRLVLDTGAQHSAISGETAARLGVPLDQSPQVIVHGTTGSSISPTIVLDGMFLGDLMLQPAALPVVADVFGGADGLLGTEGLQDQRIFMDFRHDNITISRSENRRAAAGFGTLRFLPDSGQLPVVRARVGNVEVRAIIDTGSQVTVGNLALRRALHKQRHYTDVEEQDRVQGATGDWQTGVGVNLSPIHFGAMVVRNAHVTFADLHIFNHWGLGDQPAMVVGMDIIGLADQLVIDYRRGELQIKPRTRR